jgi:NAD(P)-dependent dehydrogenase (short-subunit alcohol dehydrogenase family)
MGLDYERQCQRHFFDGEALYSGDEKKGGVVIQNASLQGLNSQKYVPAHDASKGALLSLTRKFALDDAKHNIRVLGICPVSVDAPHPQQVAEQFFPQDPASIIVASEGHPVD